MNSNVQGLMYLQRNTLDYQILTNVPIHSQFETVLSGGEKNIFANAPGRGANRGNVGFAGKFAARRKRERFGSTGLGKRLGECAAQKHMDQVALVFSAAFEIVDRSCRARQRFGRVTELFLHL